MRGEEQLREEVQEFQKEKERIRNIVGQVGGAGNKQNKIVNLVLIGIIIALLVIGGIFSRISPTLTLQLAILLGIFKIIWMFYESQRASHFQFWILNSLEFRINEIHKRIKKIEKELNEAKVKETVESQEGE